MTTMINCLLRERYPDKTLYAVVETVLNLINSEAETEFILKNYFLFENTLLNILGTGIIFGNDGMEYISPKTGLAVSKQRGEPYKDKLLLFPSLFKDDNHPKTSDNVTECFNVMDFFLKKYLSDGYHDQQYSQLLILRRNMVDSFLD